MFKSLKRLYNFVFRPAVVVPTALESSVLEYEEAVRRQLYYKKAHEDAIGSVRVVEERLRRLGRDIAKLTEEPLLNVVVRPEVIRADRAVRGHSQQTALQIAQSQLEEEEKNLLTYHRETEDANGQVDILTKRMSRLKLTINRLASEKETRETIDNAATAVDFSGAGPSMTKSVQARIDAGTNPLGRSAVPA